MNKVSGLLLLLMVLVALLLTMLTTDTLQRLQAGFLEIINPFLKTGRAVQKEIGGIGQGLKSLEQLEISHRKLEAENKKLRALNQTFHALEEENNHLRRALDYQERSAFQLIAAQVISQDSLTWWHTIKINRGFEDGVEENMPVVTDVGLVGKVINVAKSEAVVLLVTDELCKVGAYVEGVNAQGKREEGIVSGLRVQENASGELQMNFLSKEAHLQPGQKVYSKGVGAVFPAGLFLGVVQTFKPRELDGQAILRPAVDFMTCVDVFVIVGVKS